MVRRSAAAWIVVSAITLAGCAHSYGHKRVPPSNRFEDVLPPVEPNGQLEIDDRRVGSLRDVDQALGYPHDLAGHYRALTAEDCQCMAAAASSQGNSLAAERRSIEASASKHKGLTEEERVKVRVLRASELEARNESASAALQIYYHLAEAEANLPLVEIGLVEITKALDNIRQMQEQGIAIPFDKAELERQHIDLLGKKVQLNLTASQLSAQLIGLIGLATDDVDARILPLTDWTVVVALIDTEAEVAQGLAIHPEINLLAYLQRNLSAENVSVTRTVLSGANGLLGMQPKLTGMISLFGLRQILGQKRANERELPIRRRQLNEYTQQRRQEVASEIRQAIVEIETRLRQIALAKTESLAAEKRVADAEQKRVIAQASFAEVTAARLKLWQAQSDEIARVVQWKIAIVKLKEAKGQLIDECHEYLCRHGGRHPNLVEILAPDAVEGLPPPEMPDQGEMELPPPPAIEDSGQNSPAAPIENPMRPAPGTSREAQRIQTTIETADATAARLGN